MSYSIATGFKTTLGIKWIEYKRLQSPYGTCVYTSSELPSTTSYYYNGTYSAEVLVDSQTTVFALKLQGCLRSCYQNEVLKTCECMDPRYPISSEASKCDLTLRRCVNEFIEENGDPAKWTGCECPLPC